MTQATRREEIFQIKRGERDATVHRKRNVSNKLDNWRLEWQFKRNEKMEKSRSKQSAIYAVELKKNAKKQRKKWIKPTTNQK